MSNTLIASGINALEIEAAADKVEWVPGGDGLR